MKIIAEVGSNIKSFEDVSYCVTKAKEAGANAVKFQCLCEFDLYGEGSKFHKPFQLDWFDGTKELCDKLEIEFLCTAFSSDIYELVNHYVDIHKIASSEITDMHILKTVNSFGKHVYLSSGGANINQISKALEILKDCKVTIFYCVVEYPAKIINLNSIQILKSAFGKEHSYAYSDHSLDVCIIPKLARSCGAEVIEKHVNFLNYKDTPDSGHALNFDEFKLMCDDLKYGVIVQGKQNKNQRTLINGKYVRGRIF